MKSTVLGIIFYLTFGLEIISLMSTSILFVVVTFMICLPIQYKLFGGITEPKLYTITGLNFLKVKFGIDLTEE